MHCLLWSSEYLWRTYYPYLLSEKLKLRFMKLLVQVYSTSEWTHSEFKSMSYIHWLFPKCHTVENKGQSNWSKEFNLEPISHFVALCWKVWDYREGQAQTLTLRNICSSRRDRKYMAYDNWSGKERQMWLFNVCDCLKLLANLILLGGKKFQGQTPTFTCNLCIIEDYFFLPEGALKDRHLGFFLGVNKIKHKW